MPKAKRVELESALGTVSFGVFLLIVAATWMLYPLLPTEIITYLTSLPSRSAVLGQPVMPPLTLFKPAIFFAYVLGVWLLILAGIRAVAHVHGASSDAAGGVFFVACAFLFGLYTQGRVPARTLTPIIIILLGAVVTIAALLRALWQQRRESTA